MGDKNNRLTHSQTLGIVWLSIALALIVGAIIFSRHIGLPQTRAIAADSMQTTILEKKEDSVYRTRRTNHTNNRTSAPSRGRQYYRDQAQRVDSTFYSTVAPAARKQPLVVELNSADTLTLQMLHGIGPAYARRIVKYRERLGGFHSTEQLLEVYGFTPELVAHIAPYITMDTGNIRQVDINTVELKQLIKHPYIEYYQARDIIALRNKGTRFCSADDLRAIPSMADSTLDRLLPYIKF